MHSPEFEQRLVWDKITRTWHWLLAASVLSGWLLGEFRDFETIEWHFYAGYVTGGLLIWRLIWGVIGPEPIRLKTLTNNIRAVPHYLRSVKQRKASGIHGHSPIGSLAVVALLFSLTIQASSGLFLEDDTLYANGPFAYEISDDARGNLTFIHHLNAKILLGLFVLHLAAIAFYAFWKKENLLQPMINGLKWVKRAKE